ncbi:CDP-glycerol glycerophosphotransferase family protein [Geodermatophilus sp. SYSU D00703]
MTSSLIPWQAVLALPYAAAVAVTGLGWAACVAIGVAILAELWVRRSAPGSAAALRRLQLGAEVRWPVRAALVLYAVAGAGTALVVLTGFVVAAGALALTRSALLVLWRRARRHIRKQVRWQGLDVAGATTGPAAVPVQEPAPNRDEDALALLEGGFLAAALLAVIVPVQGATGVACWALLAAVLAGAGVLVGRAALRERAARSAPTATVLPAVVTALEQLAPEVVLYFSSPASGSYALRVWLDTLRALRNRVVVVLREAHHLEALDLTGLPVVVLPAAQDVELAQVPSMRVALYPTNVVKNNHMIRLPGIRHAFIGHGDSDKAGSFSPVTRVYDEIWVAGPAGRDRYLAVDEGVRDEQIRFVSRPQLAGLSRAAEPAGPASRVPTVLYAPTWEGFYEHSDYCSLGELGVRAVRTLVGSGRVRVLFKPHPASGERREDVAAAVPEIEALLADSPHRRVDDGPEALYEAMREADVLLSDVSSVLSDWLATGRPYVVANPRGLAVEELHTRFPTTRGGAVLSPEDDVLALVDEAVVRDPLAARREELARYLLGPRREDPVADFADEVAAFVARSRAAVEDRPVLVEGAR